MRMVSARELVGKRIVAFDPGVFVPCEEWRGVCHNPTITLDDGTRLYFVVEETGAEYGIFIGRTKKGKK